jgi:ankyrin repeat protein
VSIDAQRFVEAVQTGDAAEVQAELAREPALAKARWDGASPLHFAALEGDEAIVSILLQAGADPDAVDQEFSMTPLGWANERGHRALVAFLADYTRVDLRRAAAMGLIDQVRRLLNDGASAINTVVGFGAPLHEATVFGHDDVVELLLAYGADPHVRNRDGHTALEIAESQVDSNGRRTPLVNAERRAEIVDGCTRIAERLRGLMLK